MIIVGFSILGGQLHRARLHIYLQ